MEQVPNIAMFLHESRPNFPAAFSRYLVPIVVRYLTDPNNQVGVKLDPFLLIFTKKTIFTQEGQAVLFFVGCSFEPTFYVHHWSCSCAPTVFFNFHLFQVRKTSQAALLVLLEQGLLSKADMETKVCPVLLELTEPSSDDDYKIEAVAVRNQSFIFLKLKVQLKWSGLYYQGNCQDSSDTDLSTDLMPRNLLAPKNLNAT